MQTASAPDSERRRSREHRFLRSLRSLSRRSFHQGPRTAGNEAVFSVDVRKNEAANKYILSISNNGVPFPNDVTLDNPETLGLQLISALVEQLQGTIELQRAPYPVFTIRFPIAEA